MAKIWILACMLATWGLVAANHGPAKTPVPEPPVSIAPAPHSECDNLIYKMIDCLSYLRNGGKESKPDSSCCLGFEKIMKTDAKCLCVAMKSSADLGVSVNMTRAMALPSACGLSDRLPRCLHSEAPKPSPANPPSKSTPAPPSNNTPPTPSKSTPPTPSKSSPPSKGEAPTLPPAVDDSTNPAPAPAPAPKGAGASDISTNSVALLFSLIIVSFFHMLA